MFTKQNGHKSNIITGTVGEFTGTPNLTVASWQDLTMVYAIRRPRYLFSIKLLDSSSLIIEWYIYLNLRGF